MTLMKSIPAITALCFLTVSLPSSADTFTMKDGTTLEGTIINEKGDSYLIEVQITKTIKDERKITKADVVKIDREAPDKKAFSAIEKFVPAPDLMTIDDYEQRISIVERFIKSYEKSSNLKAAKTILATLKLEHSQVSAGATKLNGKMISPAEYKTNAYDFDARVKESKIRNLIYQYQFLRALREFAVFDRDYRTTLSYDAITPLMKQVIQSHVTEAKQLLSTLDARLKDRDVGLERMDTQNRNATVLAIKEETAEIEARYMAEKEAKQEWVSISPYHKASLEDTVKFGEAELVRISAVKTVLGVDGGKAYREAWSVIAKGGSPAAIAGALATAKAASIPSSYLSDLEAAANLKK
jgi:hypothetical protein